VIDDGSESDGHKTFADLNNELSEAEDSDYEGKASDVSFEHEQGLGSNEAGTETDGSDEQPARPTRSSARLRNKGKSRKIESTPEPDSDNEIGIQDDSDYAQSDGAIDDDAPGASRKRALSVNSKSGGEAEDGSESEREPKRLKSKSIFRSRVQILINMFKLAGCPSIHGTHQTTQLPLPKQRRIQLHALRLPAPRESTLLEVTSLYLPHERGYSLQFLPSTTIRGSDFYLFQVNLTILPPISRLIGTHRTSCSLISRYCCFRRSQATFYL
jgi:hypothetical protein